MYISHFCVIEHKIYDLLADEAGFELGLYKDEDEHYYHLNHLTEKRIKRPEQLY